MSGLLTKFGALFGGAQERGLRAYQKRTAAINALADETAALSDAQLRSAFHESFEQFDSAGNRKHYKRLIKAGRSRGPT